MTDKKIKDFTKGIEEIAKLHPADRKKVFQMVADRNGAAAAGYIVEYMTGGAVDFMKAKELIQTKRAELLQLLALQASGGVYRGSIPRLAFTQKFEYGGIEV